MKLLFLLTAAFLIAGKTAHGQITPPKARLTLPDAVRRAEGFIARNGYTTEPPLTDHAKISVEWIEVRFGFNRRPDGTIDVPAILANRKGRLEQAACAWKRYPATRYSQAMWLIVFRLRRSEFSAVTGRGRGVYVSESGDDVHMLHEGVRLFKCLPLGRLPLPVRP